MIINSDHPCLSKFSSIMYRHAFFYFHLLCHIDCSETVDLGFLVDFSGTTANHFGEIKDFILQTSMLFEINDEQVRKITKKQPFFKLLVFSLIKASIYTRNEKNDVYYHLVLLVLHTTNKQDTFLQ